MSFVMYHARIAMLNWFIYCNYIAFSRLINDNCKCRQSAKSSGQDFVQSDGPPLVPGVTYEYQAVELLCLTDLFISITLHSVDLSMINANADSPPSHQCDGLTNCQNGRRASIGNYGIHITFHPISLCDCFPFKVDSLSGFQLKTPPDSFRIAKPWICSQVSYSFINSSWFTHGWSLKYSAHQRGTISIKIWRK